MRWSRIIVAVLGCGLAAGCELAVTFETVPEGSGGTAGGGASATTSTAPTTGGAGGTTTPTGGAGGTTTPTGGAGGAPCTAECCSDADCPAPAAPCQTVACESGQCALTAIPDGAAAAAQTPGDCKKLVCQGGVATAVTDASDVLDDGNPCTADTCNGNTPKTSTLNQETACALPDGTPGLCNGKGKCVECTSSIQCPAGAPKCENSAENGVCVPQQCSNGVKDGAETDVDCGGPDCGSCNNGHPCLQNADCENGVCVNLQCAAPTCTDGVKNGNEADVDCGDACDNECAAGQHCNKPSDCQGGQCTGTGGVCLANCNDGVQNGTESDVDCGGGVCKACGAGKACGGVDGNCLSGDCGPAGTCAQGELGTPCSAVADCLSAHCTDGLCCNTACTGTCRSCKLAGSEGTCAFIPAGQDPQNECLSACDGNGACAP